MDTGPQNSVDVFAVLALLFGGYSTVFGKLTFYPGEDESLAQTLHGGKARFVGIIMLISSLLLFFGNKWGYVALVLALFMPFLITKSKR